jgi:coniferyl-aldehyde dehydrogenase
VLAPVDRLSDFVNEAKASVAKLFPTIRESPDYTAIVSDRNCARLMDYLTTPEARASRSIRPATTCASSRTAASRRP